MPIYGSANRGQACDVWRSLAMCLEELDRVIYGLGGLAISYPRIMTALLRQDANTHPDTPDHR